MQGLLQLITSAWSQMERSVPSPEVSCNTEHDCCSKHMSMKNQEGMLCTLFDVRYIFTTIDGIPHLLPLLPPQKLEHWASVLSTVVWQELALHFHKRFSDGTTVRFDAVRVKRTPLYQILCIWIDCKPKCFQLPSAQQFLVMQCHYAVPCTYSGPQKDFVSVNINGQIKVFKKPHLSFHNNVPNVAPCSNTFSGFFLEILENSADSSDILSMYEHSLMLHAVYEGDLPSLLRNIQPMTIYVQNGLGNLESSLKNHTFFLDTTIIKQEDNLTCSVNGKEQSTLNGLSYFHFCPYRRYSAHVIKIATGYYTAVALQDCLCCDYNGLSRGESVSSPEHNPKCLSSPYWFCQGSVMSLGHKQSVNSQLNEDGAQKCKTTMDTGYGPLKFGALLDLDSSTPDDGESKVTSGNSATCNSIASNQGETDATYIEKQTCLEKHLSLHPEWVSKSDSPGNWPVTTVNSDPLEEDTKFSQFTVTNFQYILKFIGKNEEILDDLHYVHCLDDIYQQLSSTCVIPSTAEFSPLCNKGTNIFVLQSCTNFMGFSVANSIRVVAHNNHFALLKVPFKKLYVVCPLKELPRLPLEAKTSVLYSKESCTKVLGTEVCVGFRSWSTDQPPVLCHHSCAQHRLQVKLVNHLGCITTFSANNKGKYLHHCAAKNNIYPPFSESTLRGLEFTIVPADIIAFEKGLLHLALDNVSHEHTTCPPENVFLANNKSNIERMLQNEVFDIKVLVVMHSTKVLFVYDQLMGTDCLHMCPDHHPVTILRRQKRPATAPPLIPDLAITNHSSLQTDLSTGDTGKLTKIEESVASKDLIKNTASVEGTSIDSSERIVNSTPTRLLVEPTNVPLLQPSSEIGGTQAMASSQSKLDEATNDPLICYETGTNNCDEVSNNIAVDPYEYVVPLTKKNLDQNCILLSASDKMILLPLSNIHNRASLLQEVELHPEKKFSITLLCSRLESPIIFDGSSVNLVAVVAYAGQRSGCCQEILEFSSNKGDIISQMEVYEMLLLSNVTETCKLSVLGKIIVLADEYGILKFSVAINGSAYYAKFSIQDLEMLGGLNSNTPSNAGYSVEDCLFKCCYAIVKQDQSKQSNSKYCFIATHIVSGSVENILKSVTHDPSNSGNWSLLLEHFVSLSSAPEIKTLKNWNAAYPDDTEHYFADRIDNFLRMGSQQHPNCQSPSDGTKATVFSNTESISASNATIFPANTESTSSSSAAEATQAPATATTSSPSSNGVMEMIPPSGTETLPCEDLILALASKTSPAVLVSENPSLSDAELSSSLGISFLSSVTLEPNSSHYAETISQGMETTSSYIEEMTSSLDTEISKDLEKDLSLSRDKASLLDTETTPCKTEIASEVDTKITWPSNKNISTNIKKIVKTKKEGVIVSSSKTKQKETTHLLHSSTDSNLTDVSAPDWPSKVHKAATTSSLVTSKVEKAPREVNQTPISKVASFSTALMQGRTEPNGVNRNSSSSAAAQRDKLSNSSVTSCPVARVVSDSIMSSIGGVSSKSLKIPPVMNNVLTKVHTYCASVKNYYDDHAILCANKHYMFLPYNKLYINSNENPLEILKASSHSPSVLCVSVKPPINADSIFIDGFCFAAYIGKKPKGLETVKKIIEFAHPKTLQQSINDCIRNSRPSNEAAVNEHYPDSTNINNKDCERILSRSVERLNSGKSSDFTAENLMESDALNLFDSAQTNHWPQLPLLLSTKQVPASGAGSLHAGMQRKSVSHQEEDTIQQMNCSKDQNRNGKKLMTQNKIEDSSSNIASETNMIKGKKNLVSTSKKPNTTSSKCSSCNTENANLKLKQTVVKKSSCNDSISTTAKMSTLLEGKISDTHRDLGELETADGKKLFFHPKQCYLFGVSLEGLELWHILVKALPVQYEVNNDTGTLMIRAVYVGAWNDGTLSNSEIKRNIRTWCLDKGVHEEARDSLVKRVARASMRREIVPQVGDNDQREVVVITSADSE